MDLKEKNFNFARHLDNMVAKSSNSFEVDYNGKHKIDPNDYKLYTEEEILRVINGSSILDKIKLSRNYFFTNGTFKELVLYYATLMLHRGFLIPLLKNQNLKIDDKNISKRYYQALNYINNMDLTNFLNHCSLTAVLDGTYYGVKVNVTKDNFSVLDLPSAYCSSYFKDIEGNDLIDFDLSYFDSISNAETRDDVLKAYPKEISKAYADYKKATGNKKRELAVMTIPSDIGICFTLVDGRPFLVNIIPLLLKQEDGLNVEIEKEKAGIKKILTQKIPHLNTGEFLLDIPEVEELHAGAVGMMKSNPNISVLTTYADTEIEGSETTNSKSYSLLDKTTSNIYSQAGVSHLIFNSDTSMALEPSINNDISIMMTLEEKFARFVTNIINSQFANGSISFNYKILEVSKQNCSKILEDSIKLATLGYSQILPSVINGVDQYELMNLKNLENNLLGLKDNLVPLQTSYTQTGSKTSDGEPGAPNKDPLDKNPKTLEIQEKQ